MVSRATTIGWSVAGIAVVGLVALAVPAVSSVIAGIPHERSNATATTTTETAPAPSPSPSDSPVPAATCASKAFIVFDVPDQKGPIFPKLYGGLRDAGPEPGAEGVAHLDAEGRVASYTVAAGDAPSSLEDRFCLMWTSLYRLNHVWADDGKTIQPGDVLILRPDPTVEWTPPPRSG